MRDKLNKLSFSLDEHGAAESETERPIPCLPPIKDFKYFQFQSMIQFQILSSLKSAENKSYFTIEILKCQNETAYII